MPKINGAFFHLRAFIVALGGRGIIVPFYSVQVCSISKMVYSDYDVETKSV